MSNICTSFVKQDVFCSAVLWRLQLLVVGDGVGCGCGGCGDVVGFDRVGCGGDGGYGG